MSSDHLVDFIRARLDDEQRAAEAATPGPWWYNPGKQWLGPEAFERYDQSKGEEFVGYGGPHPFTGAVAATGPASNPQSMADAAFIACHDPARVLAEVAAKRRIIEAHPVDTDVINPGYREHVADFGCRICHDWDGVTEGYGYCLTLRLLALPYANHPDYREEWKP